jgi:exosortase/archaeosortase family protein
MPAALALPALLIAFWDAWRLLAGRFGDGPSALPLILVLLLVAIPAIRRILAGDAPAVPLLLLCSGLGLYLAASVGGPVLARIAVAVSIFVLVCYRVAAGRSPPAPLAGLALLVMPVLPSLDFYLAYPMRLMCATLAAGLLRLNGLAVSVEGVALRWNGSLLMFDAACSGVRMLWAASFMVSAIGLAAGFGPWLYARALLVALALAIAGNALRAASLFYVENGFVQRLQGPVVHEAVGIAAFLLLAMMTALLVAPRQWRPL